MTRRRMALLILLSGLLVGTVVLAVGDGLVQSALTGGGGRSEVDSLVLLGAVGQSIGGRSTSGDSVLCSGWPACPPPATSTPTATNTPTMSATATNTPAATGTATNTPTATATATGAPTATATATNTPAATATGTGIPTATGTATNTPTATATSTPIATATGTPTLTPTAVPTATLASPMLLAPADGSTSADKTPTFGWSLLADAIQYQLQVDNDADFSSPEVNVLAAVSDYTVGSSLADDSYSWRVRAKDDAGNWSDWSASWTATIRTTYRLYLPALQKGD